MTPAVLALVLLAAVLHASWNALLKSGADRFRSMAVMTGASGLACLPLAAALPWPAAASLPSLLASTALHTGYNLFLVRAYRYGDLGQVYPVARGSSPLLVTLGAALLAGERPGSAAVLGVALVSVGILSLARGWGAAAHQQAGRGLATAFATGCFIAGYTVADGLGGRASGHPLSYALWLFVAEALPLLAIYASCRGGRRGLCDLIAADRATLKSAAGGIVSLTAYAAVIFAASVSPMGPVSALRETSVVFAALIGRLFLGEALTARRLTSCALVAVGAVALGFGG